MTIVSQIIHKLLKIKNIIFQFIAIRVALSKLILLNYEDSVTYSSISVESLHALSAMANHTGWKL